MNYRKKLMFLPLLFIIADCSGQNELEEPTPIPSLVPSLEAATPLPTAVQPETTTGGNWALTFRYDFPEMFWEPGDHTYGFVIECPNTNFDFKTEWIFFRVTENAEHVPFPIYLRLNGLSMEPFTPTYSQEARIHPDQETAAIVHLVGLTEEQVEEARSECDLLIGWDRAAPQNLEPMDAFKP